MNQKIPFTRVSLRRALAVAQQMNVRLVLRPDGTMTFDPMIAADDGKAKTVEGEAELVL
jgi:hypothetical protein